MAQIIDGKNISSLVKEDVKKEIEALKQQNIKVCLAVIIVGDDPASKVYVGNKKKACEATGIESLEYALPADTTEEELLCLIEKLNNDPAVNGILCQLPLPKHINEKRVINTISAKKDVDAFHPENVGHIMIGDYTFLPCTPAGVMEMLERTGIEVQGKHCVIVGRSNIVGKPAAALMLNKSATVTVCHSKTVNLKEICLTADILIAAGKMGLSNVQFNTIDADTLLDAQKNPEKYNNLAVRVSGFSQRFNLLDKEMQDHIIGRTKHSSL